MASGLRLAAAGELHLLLRVGCLLRLDSPAWAWDASETGPPNSPVPVHPTPNPAVVFSLLADLALFHHRPSPLSLLGAALVCASSLLLALLGKRSSSGGSSSSSSSGASAPVQLKAKHSSSIEVAAAAYWQQPQQGQQPQRGWRSDAGTGEAARQAELAELGGLAAGTQQGVLERQRRHAAGSPRSGSRLGSGDEGGEGDEREPLVRGSGGS